MNGFRCVASTLDKGPEKKESSLKRSTWGESSGPTVGPGGWGPYGPNSSHYGVGGGGRGQSNDTSGARDQWTVSTRSLRTGCGSRKSTTTKYSYSRIPSSKVDKGEPDGLRFQDTGGDSDGAGRLSTTDLCRLPKRMDRGTGRGEHFLRKTGRRKECLEPISTRMEVVSSLVYRIPTSVFGDRDH